MWGLVGGTIVDLRNKSTEYIVDLESDHSSLSGKESGVYLINEVLMNNLMSPVRVDEPSKWANLNTQNDVTGLLKKKWFIEYYDYIRQINQFHHLLDTTSED